ncbi:MAG TPA: acetyl-CoA carboxylase biotin carboxyl carrier protein [Lacipirellulaceae bacterium]|nr:acetyl-CoA carboxylase biotin carboxyl carrier protein [Lacipirellulaceae bacterium]
MGSSSGNADDVFDVRRVRRLVELMQEFELAEIDLRQAEQRIRLRKDQDPVVAPGGYAPPPAPAAPAPVAAPAGGSAPGPAAPASSGEPAGALYVTSPMVGTFYLSSSPDSPPFVKVGDQVGPETVVCIVEAMKVFNEIPAEVSGKITAILVENAAAVEYGQKLFRVEK